ncbi:hypothetical protein [Metapseudomonas boanensis]|uniref:Uncharacterized protein n=1 Tax=Metapseudomonas boanensis TaxID=2822138 RepID=A0ABS5XPK0_9GAMM|nr:hypothetical protein [Pseudomonas boanensis]MBT8769025.1 hypothetical protein [Pseudomonas boanensis]
MKGFNAYLMWLCALALFGACGLYFSFYPSSAWQLGSVGGALLLGGGLYALLAWRERLAVLFKLDSGSARLYLHLTLGSLMALVAWGALNVPVAALYTQWFGVDAEFTARVLAKEEGGLGCGHRIALVLDDQAVALGVCVPESLWRTLPESGEVLLQGKRSGLGISPRQVVKLPEGR